MRDEGDEAVLEEPTAVAPAPELARKTVEQWATAKGMLPEKFEQPQPAIHAGGEMDPRMGRPVHVVNMARAGRRPPRVNPNHWKFNGARAGEKWPEGLTMTEAEFDAAIARVTHGHTYR